MRYHIAPQASLAIDPPLTVRRYAPSTRTRAVRRFLRPFAPSYVAPVSNATLYVNAATFFAAGFLLGAFPFVYAIVASAHVHH